MYIRECLLCSAVADGDNKNYKFIYLVKKSLNAVCRALDFGCRAFWVTSSSCFIKYGGPCIENVFPDLRSSNKVYQRRLC